MFICVLKHFLKDVCRQINKYGKKEYKPRIQEESYLSCAVRNICDNNLSDDMKPLYELCEYYRLIRNNSVHDLCEVDSHEKEYRKLQKYNFKTEAKFSKLIAQINMKKIRLMILSCFLEPVLNWQHIFLRR